MNILTDLWAYLYCSSGDFVTNIGIFCPAEIPAPGKSDLAEYHLSFVYFLKPQIFLVAQQSSVM